MMGKLVENAEAALAQTQAELRSANDAVRAVSEQSADATAKQAVLQTKLYELENLLAPSKNTDGVNKLVGALTKRDLREIKQIATRAPPAAVKQTAILLHVLFEPEDSGRRRVGNGGGGAKGLVLGRSGIPLPPVLPTRPHTSPAPSATPSRTLLLPKSLLPPVPCFAPPQASTTAALILTPPEHTSSSRAAEVSFGLSQISWHQAQRTLIGPDLLAK
eukprot:gene31964-16495_t